MLGHGTKLNMPDPNGAAGAYVAVAEVRNLDGPSMTRDSVEKTHLNSPDGWREFIPGLKDGGEVSFDLNFDPTELTHGAVNGLLSMYGDNDVYNFQIVFPNVAATTWTLPCFVTNFGAAVEAGEVITASVTLKVAGKPVLANAGP